METAKTMNVNDLRSEDQLVNMVYATDDLDRFNFHDKNRAVNPAHVDNLETSVRKKNLLEDQPILVNEVWDIIDGQHRLTVAKRLDETIYYIMREGLTVEDAITLNINTKNWTYKDYLRYWIKQGKEHYIYFKRFMDKYGTSYSVTTGMLGLGQATSGNQLTQVFNSGKFKAKHKEYAEDLGAKLLKMKEHGDFANSRSFVLAFDEVMRIEEFDFEEFLHKVEMVPDRFARRSDTARYLRMIEDVYNYNRRGKRVQLYR